MTSVNHKRCDSSHDALHEAANDSINSPSANQMTDRQVRHVLLTLLLGGTVISFSNSALNPAIPIFMSVFAVDIVMGGWVLNAYVLAMSVGLMLSGYLSKKLAFKPVYAAAMIGFMLGSVVGMQATSMVLVIVARAIQGLSGGLIIPLSIGMLYQMYLPHQHGRVMALWGIVIMMSLATGPLIGAYLVEQLAWWTLFAATLPLSAMVIVMAWRLLPSEGTRQSSERHASTKRANKPFDTVGFVSLLVWLLALMTWLSTLKTNFQDDFFSMVGTAFLSLVFMGVFILWWQYERRQSQPLLDVRLFGNAVYLHSTIISTTQTLGMMICLLLLPVLIQDVMGDSAVWTGVILAISTLVASITTHFAGRCVDSHGARTIGLLGVTISALSMLLLAWCLYQPTLLLLMLVMSIQGVGVGLAYLPTTTVGLSSLAASSVTDGAALNNISRRIVATIVITLVTVYIQGRSVPSFAAGSHQSSVAAIQEVLVVIAVILFLTISSARQLPNTAQTST